MNVIFTYKATQPFTQSEQTIIDSKVDYNQIPEMKVVDEFDIDDNLIARTIPYQSDVPDQSTFDELKALLETKGVVTIIGQWNNDGSLISYDAKLYRDALKDIETFETAVFLDGQDYTGIEDTFVPIKSKDEKGKLIKDIDGKQVFDVPSRREFVRVKSIKKPTLAQAKTMQVNSFNIIKREL